MRFSRCSDTPEIRDDSFGKGIGAVRQICGCLHDDFRGILHVPSGAICLLLGTLAKRPEFAADPIHKPSAPKTDRAVSASGCGDSQNDGSCYTQPDPRNGGETARFRCVTRREPPS